MESVEKEHQHELTKAKEAMTQVKAELDKVSGSQTTTKERSDVLAGELKRQVEELSKRLETTQTQKHEAA